MSDGGVRRITQAGAHLPLTLWGGLLVVGILAAGVAAGDLTPGATTTEVSELDLGTRIDTGPYDITIERARVLDELPGVSEGDDATHVIALVVTASANGTRTLGGGILADSVALRGVDGLVPRTETSSAATEDDENGDGRAGDDDGGSDDGSDDRGDDANAGPSAPVAPSGVFVIADGSRLDALQPGIDYEVAMVWEQSAQLPPPTELEVVMTGRTLRESSLDRSMEWLDRATVAVGTVPVIPPDPAESGAAG
ncbi:hypothetical protein [Phytoactinopolyspora endophytica]|uniref:hypothetical protein n=1 Tax=Phytoactinopolyspora endophytica TaxID=1642495 RepID=UPI00101D61E0|nr:hypothetical protein [Phytoactinopolyspora endophytica]